MKKTKLIVSALLSGAMALSLFTGCGSQSSGDGKIKEFTAFYATAGKEMPDNNRVKQAIAKKIGATIKESWLTGQTAKERIGVMIAGGEYPDIIYGGQGTQALIDSGALVPLEDKIDKYPNISKFLSETDRKKLTRDDGHIYYIPPSTTVNGKQTEANHGGEAFWIQKAVLEWANFPKIKTVDQYFDLIEKYKTANPTIDGKPTIGFEILSWSHKYWCLENPPQFLAGYPNDGAAIIDKNTLTAKSYNTIPEAKQYYKKLNQEYNKGIIDPETFTANYDQYISKLSTGRVLGMIDQHWQFATAEQAIKQQNLDERTYVPLPLTLDPNVEAKYRDKTPFNAGEGVSITTSCKDIDGALKAINDLLDPEIRILRAWGEKDVDYKVDDSGLFYRTDEQRNNQRDQDWVNQNLCSYKFLPFYSGLLADGKNAVVPDDQEGEFWATLSETDKKILNGYGYKKFTDFMNTPPEKNEAWYPIYTYTGSLTPDDPAGLAIQKGDEVKMQWLPKVIMVKPDEFDSAYNEYQTTLKSKVDIKAFEDSLTKEVRRRVEKFGDK